MGYLCSNICIYIYIQYMHIFILYSYMPLCNHCNYIKKMIPQGNGLKIPCLKPLRTLWILGGTGPPSLESVEAFDPSKTQAQPIGWVYGDGEVDGFSQLYSWTGTVNGSEIRREHQLRLVVEIPPGGDSQIPSVLTWTTLHWNSFSEGSLSFSEGSLRIGTANPSMVDRYHHPSIVEKLEMKPFSTSTFCYFELSDFFLWNHSPNALGLICSDLFGMVDCDG